MDQERWTAVDGYLGEVLVGEDAVLAGVVEASKAAGMPEIQVSACQGKFLQVMARAVGARRILEIGTLGGYSAIWMGRALPADGKLVTLEIDPRHAELARGNIARAGLSRVVDVRVGKALELLPGVAGEGPFDLIFIDADKVNNVAYFGWAMKLCRRGSLIVVDNVVREGAVVDGGSGDASVQGTRRVLEAMAAEKRVCVTALQTVGSKGYDGFAVGVVVADIIGGLLFRAGSDWRVYDKPLTDRLTNDCVRRIGLPLPTNLLELYHLCNGGEGSLPFQPWVFVLWGIDNVATTREHEHFRKHYDRFVLFGSNGAGEYFGLDAAGRVFYMDPIAGEGSIVVVAQSFDEFIGQIGFLPSGGIPKTGKK